MAFTDCPPTASTAEEIAHRLSPADTPPRKAPRFKSFLAGSPEDADSFTHLFDSPGNRNNRTKAFEGPWLPTPPVAHAPGILPELWARWCDGPCPEFLGNSQIVQVNLIGDEWAKRTLFMIEEAMPEYKGYNMSQVIIMECIQSAYVHQTRPDDMFYCVEHMAGMGKLSCGFAALGMKSLRLDKKFSHQCDLAIPIGTKNTMLAQRMVHPKGLSWFGVECSSWVWLSRSSALRGDSPERAMGHL